MKTDFFFCRTLLIATKHGKEQVIGPILQETMGLTTWTPSDYDTDIFGNFTGETVRQHDPLTTARKKCLLALEKYNFDLGIASEGSFGPHPSLAFFPGDEEFLILIDKKNKLEIVIREVSTETNFSGSELRNTDELQAFAESVLFPGHALIIKDKKYHFSEVRKGIDDWIELYTTFDYFFHKYGKVYAETDMRAHLNPSRMKVIQKATDSLVQRMLSACPSCHFPGFSVREYKTGLPCQLCHEPTKSTLSHTSTCQYCGHSEVKYFPRGTMYEDPAYCDICNP